MRTSSLGNPARSRRQTSGREMLRSCRRPGRATPWTSVWRARVRIPAPSRSRETARPARVRALKSASRSLAYAARCSAPPTQSCAVQQGNFRPVRRADANASMADASTSRRPAATPNARMSGAEAERQGARTTFSGFHEGRGALRAGYARWMKRRAPGKRPALPAARATPTRGRGTLRGARALLSVCSADKDHARLRSRQMMTACRRLGRDALRPVMATRPGPHPRAACSRNGASG